VQRSLGPQELVDLAIDRALAPPLYKRVKQEPIHEGAEGKRNTKKPSAHFGIHIATITHSLHPYAYFCHRFSSSSTLSDTPSLKPPLE
jgi:hypothetical protein